jgi:urease accessory protein
MLTYTTIIGSASEPALAARLHRLEHDGRVDYVTLAGDDVQRRRLRVHTDGGAECGIALERSLHLFDGAVLRLDAGAALVVRTVHTAWLRLRARDVAAALELGYFAGNMHWPVRFEGALLCIALKGTLDDYLQRLKPMLSCGSIEVAPNTGDGQGRGGHG